ncbi:hypothetical protein LP52_02540 [Streptomonospora alba]|uniref:Uncharacterized protein n=1 Tax=Streptomonospora alba TaxID=183763 RepID=A0A0C2FLP9_9ACTN|nr:hypothetical protein [Streptomonospora alba]KII00215.1 hypothetical protein LP52_02540 [Streptomonospora alba]
MATPSGGKAALIAAPIAAAVATAILTATAGPVPQVLAWGGSTTLISLAPLIVPAPYRRTAIWICAAAVLAAVGLAILTIGAYFVPALIALVVAGATCRPRSV